jgi:hypothetical protein
MLILLLMEYFISFLVHNLIVLICFMTKVIDFPFSLFCCFEFVSFPTVWKHVYSWLDSGYWFCLLRFLSNKKIQFVSYRCTPTHDRRSKFILLDWTSSARGICNFICHSCNHAMIINLFFFLQSLSEKHQHAALFLKI